MNEENSSTPVVRPATLSFPGHPSLCYQHDGDGKCEDFEEKTSIKDCGFHTPEGFEDQWAISVTVNPLYNQSECSEDVVIGPPARDLVSKLIP